MTFDYFVPQLAMKLLQKKKCVGRISLCFFSYPEPYFLIVFL